jgi:HTH-type transcriptional regulator/antitoxin HipB
MRYICGLHRLGYRAEIYLVGFIHPIKPTGTMTRYLAPTPKELGQLVRGYRRQRRLTQAQLALQAGLLPKTISTIEAGTGHVLLTNVMRCLSALEVDLDLASRTSVRPEEPHRPQLV